MSCGKLYKWLETRSCAARVRKFCLKLRGERRKRCWTFQDADCVLLDLGICGDFKYFVIFLIYGFGSGFKLGDMEGCSLGGGVGANWISCTLGTCETAPPLDLLLVCWGYSDPEIFYFESVAAVVIRVIFVSVVEMCFCARCGKSDWSHFLLHHHTTIKEVSLAGSS